MHSITEIVNFKPAVTAVTISPIWIEAPAILNQAQSQFHRGFTEGAGWTESTDCFA